MPADISDQTFEKEVKQSNVPVLVDFWAPWCGPCRALAPIIEELSKEYDGKVKFVKVNTDDNPVEASNLRISSIPTLVIFKGGKAVQQVVGVRPKSDIAKLLDAAL